MSVKKDVDSQREAVTTFIHMKETEAILTDLKTFCNHRTVALDFEMCHGEAMPKMIQDSLMIATININNQMDSRFYFGMSLDVVLAFVGGMLGLHDEEIKSFRAVGLAGEEQGDGAREVLNVDEQRVDLGECDVRSALRARVAHHHLELRRPQHLDARV